MSWQDKLQATRASLMDWPELEIVFDGTQEGAPEPFLEQLTTSFPFLSSDYLEFLRTSDGMQLDMCVLFGSGESSFESLSRAADRWRDIIDLTLYCPIGEDADGCCFTLNRAGELWRFDHDSPNPTDAHRLASSFSDFLENVMMGERYATIFDGRLPAAKESEWLQHLIRQGWIKAK